MRWFKSYAAANGLSTVTAAPVIEAKVAKPIEVIKPVVRAKLGPYEAVAVGEKPTPVSVVIEQELDEMEAVEYARLCKSLKLGYPTNEETETQAILKVLHSLNIQVFPADLVHSYLNKLFNCTHQGWFWRPLREEDRYRTTRRRWNQTQAPEPNGCVLENPYKPPLPLGVLLTAEKIANDIPNVGFFVSDARNESDVKDPFLAISTAKMSEMIVVEVWDEPGFKR